MINYVHGLLPVDGLVIIFMGSIVKKKSDKKNVYMGLKE
jgi:hypothetical protein